MTVLFHSQWPHNKSNILNVVAVPKILLKTTFLPTPLVFDLEFEGHAVEILATKFGTRKLE